MVPRTLSAKSQTFIEMAWPYLKNFPRKKISTDDVICLSFGRIREVNTVIFYTAGKSLVSGKNVSITETELKPETELCKQHY